MSRLWLIVGLLAAFASQPVLALSSLPQSVLEQLKKSKIPASAASAYVQDLDSGKILLSWHADVSRNPASVMKLLTTGAALDILGPTFQWKTRFAALSDPVNDTLRGDLYLQGGGDPHLVSESFWADLRALRHRGIRNISGDLILDNSYFQPLVEDAGAFDGEPLRSYNAGPDALLFNFRSVHFYFRPDVLRGRVEIVADPPPGNVRVLNQVKLVKAKCSTKMSKIKIATSQKNGKSNVVFSGSFPRGCGDAELYRVVTTAENTLFGAFRSFWEEMGGVFSGDMKQGVTPVTAKTLFTGKSLPLADIIRKVNKQSNNVMARQLLLTLGAEKKGEPGTREKGREVIREWLAAMGVKSGSVIVDNGSGLSRKGRVSAADLGAVLNYMYRSKNMAEFMSALSVNGADGTMKKRLMHGEIAAAARMKTGTLDNSKAVAGYLQSKKGRHLALVMMVNHARSGASRSAQDSLIRWFYENY